MDRIFLLIYRLIIAPFLFIAAVLLSPFHQKLRATLALRKRSPDWPAWLGQYPTLWVHCASGEFEYARPVIREWKAMKPNSKVFVSYYSPSYKRFIEQSPDVDFSAPLPLDLPGPMRGFIKRLKPEVLAVSRTDLWPEMCEQARSLNIPIVLFSATRSSLSGVKRWLTPFWRWRYNQADVLTVTDEDARLIRDMGVKTPVNAVGDSRFDQVIYRLLNPRQTRSELKPTATENILVAGSTWPEDEAVLIPAIVELLKTNQLQLIIAPHEIQESHLSQIEKRLEKLQISSQRYSNTAEWTSPVLIVDQIGILAELYQWGQLAFVGGSYRSSVHSVMEPLAAGSITFVGPYHRNNREAIEFQKETLSFDMQMVMCANDIESLKTLVTTALEDSTRSSWPTRIQAAVRKRAGSSKRIAQYLIEASI